MRRFDRRPCNRRHRVARASDNRLEVAARSRQRTHRGALSADWGLMREMGGVVRGMVLRNWTGVIGVPGPLGTGRAANLRGNGCGDDKNRDDERERAANHLRTSIVCQLDPQPANAPSHHLPCRFHRRGSRSDWTRRHPVFSSRNTASAPLHWPSRATRRSRRRTSAIMSEGREADCSRMRRARIHRLPADNDLGVQRTQSRCGPNSFAS